MFDFIRRINRLTYFVAVLLSIVILIAGVLLLDVYDNSFDSGTSNNITLTVFLLLIALVGVYNICLVKQRCNDLSNDHSVLFTILFICSGLSILLLFLPGEKKANQYGKVPKKGISLR